ncbi:hypothetical protein [Acidiphilium acidophilum]|uniref:hypothetical protein n=1 Tax=Acidiphilium acidophilum TaxID=76588 RepID=UPI002E8E7253|nr:hypothetical protein [Acidiphilium acidophilum]
MAPPLDLSSYIDSADLDPHLATDTIPSAKPKSSKPPRRLQVISPDQASISNPTPLRAAVLAARAALLSDPATPVWSLARTLPVVGLIDFCQGQPADSGAITAFIQKKSRHCTGDGARFRAAFAGLVYSMRIEKADLDGRAKAGLKAETLTPRAIGEAYETLVSLSSHRLVRAIFWLRTGVGSHGRDQHDAVRPLIFQIVNRCSESHSFATHPSLTVPGLVNIGSRFFRRSHESGVAVCSAGDSRSAAFGNAENSLKKEVIRCRTGLNLEILRAAVRGDADALAIAESTGLAEVESVLPYAESDPDDRDVVRWLDRRIADLSRRSAKISAAINPSSLNAPAGDEVCESEIIDYVHDADSLDPEQAMIELETVSLRRARLVMLVRKMAARVSKMNAAERRDAKKVVQRLADEAEGSCWPEVVRAASDLLAVLRGKAKAVTVTKQVDPVVVDPVTKSTEPGVTKPFVEPVVTKPVNPTPAQLALPILLPVTTRPAKPQRIRPTFACAIDQPSLSLYIEYNARPKPSPILPDQLNPDPAPGLGGVVQTDQRLGRAGLQQVVDQPAFRPDSLSRPGLLNLAVRPLPRRPAMADLRPGPRGSPPLLDLRKTVGIRPGLGPPDLRADRLVLSRGRIGPPGAVLACIGLPRSAHPHQPLGP